MVSNQKSQLCALLLAAVALAAPQLIWMTFLPCLLLLTTPTWQLSKWWNKAVDDPRLPHFLQKMRVGDLPLPDEVSAHMGCKKHRACRFSCRRFQEASWVMSRAWSNKADSDKKTRNKSKRVPDSGPTRRNRARSPAFENKLFIPEAQPVQEENAEVVTTTGFCDLVPFPAAHPNVGVLNNNVVGCCFSCGITFVMARHTTDKSDGGAKGLLLCQGCTHHYRVQTSVIDSRGTALRADYATSGRLLVSDDGDKITACFCKRLGCGCGPQRSCSSCLPWMTRKKGCNVHHSLKDVWLTPAQQGRQFAIDVVMEENATRAAQQETPVRAGADAQPIRDSGASAAGQVIPPAPPTAPPANARGWNLAVSRSGRIITV